MGHTEDKCWRMNGKAPSTFVNLLEILVNVEEITLIELNRLCEIKHIVFSNVHMPKRKMHVQAFTSRGGTKKLHDNEGMDVRNLGANGNIKSFTFH
jgi:hypothetical protein